MQHSRASRSATERVHWLYQGKQQQGNCGAEVDAVLAREVHDAFEKANLDCRGNVHQYTLCYCIHRRDSDCSSSVAEGLSKSQRTQIPETLSERQELSQSLESWVQIPVNPTLVGMK